MQATDQGVIDGVMDQGAIEGAIKMQATDQGAIEGAMDGASDRSGGHRRSDGWCE